MIPESIRITYGGESGMSNYWEMSSEVLYGGDAADWMIGNAGSGILFLVTQTGEYFC